MTFAPSLGFEPWCLEVSYTTQPYCLVPFAPSEMSAFTPEAAWVVGASDTYSFQLHGADGGVMEIEKYWDPVPVAPEEADYERRRVEARIRASEPDWVWKGPDVPSTKPAYRRFYPDHSGRIWVLRDGPSARVPGCDLEGSIADRRVPACFEPEPILDAFGPDGRYLGSVALPPHVVLTRDMFIRDDLVLLPAIDDAGTPMVKRYRLVMPAG